MSLNNTFLSLLLLVPSGGENESVLTVNRRLVVKHVSLC